MAGRGDRVPLRPIATSTLSTKLFINELQFLLCVVQTTLYWSSDFIASVTAHPGFHRLLTAERGDATWGAVCGGQRAPGVE